MGRRMAAEGASYIEIAERCDVSPATATEWVLDAAARTIHMTAAPDLLEARLDRPSARPSARIPREAWSDKLAARIAAARRCP